VSHSRRKLILRFAAIYALLWLLTATWGLRDINRDFDKQFAFAVANDEGLQEEMVRIDQVDIKDPYRDPPPAMHGRYWRWRGKAIVLAPFIVTDQAGYQDAPLSGIGGRRIVFWCFGWSLPIWVRAYWVS
jgi:hypothetical protein